MKDFVTSSTLWPEVSQFLSDSWVHKFGSMSQEFRFDQRIPESLMSMVLDSPYPGMAVPDSFCGGGANLAECCRVQMILGFYNPGLAIGLNMHLFTLGVMTEHWKREKDISWMLLEGIAKKNSLVASAFAEPGLSGHILRSNTKARKVTGGYLLNGIKVPCSLASRSELLCLQAEVQGSDGPELIVGLLPTGTKGVRIRQTNAMWGMPHAESDEITLTDCLLPDALVFHKTIPGVDHQHVFSASMVWFCLTASAVYLGLMNRAFTESIDLLRGTSSGPGASMKCESGSVQTQWGRLWAKYSTQEQAAACLSRLASETRSGAETLLSESLALKCSVSDQCSEIVSSLAELVGGKSYVKDQIFTDLLRDSQAVKYHPPVTSQCQKIISQRELGKQSGFSMELGTS